MTAGRTRSALLSGLVALVVPAATLVALHLAAAAQTCEGTGIGECLGQGLATMAVTLPTAYLVWALSLRAARLRLPWITPVVVVAVTTALLVPLDLELWVLVTGIALVGAGWGAATHPTRDTEHAW